MAELVAVAEPVEATFTKIYDIRFLIYEVQSNQVYNRKYLIKALPRWLSVSKPHLLRFMIFDLGFPKSSRIKFIIENI